MIQNQIIILLQMLLLACSGLSTSDTIVEVFRWEDDVISSSVALFDNHLLYANRQSKIRCLDLNNPAESWEFKLKENLYNQPLILEDKIVLVSENGDLFVLTKNSGELLFRHQFKGRVKTKMQAFSRLVLISVRGQGVFTLDISTFHINSVLKSNSEVTSTNMLVHGEIMVVGDIDEKLVSVDLSSGKKMWEKSYENSLLSAPIVIDNFVYFGATHLLDPSKSFVSRIDLVTGEEGQRVFFGIDTRFSIVEYNDAVLAVTDKGIVSINLKDYGTEVFYDGVLLTEMLVSGGKVFFGTQERHFYAKTFQSMKLINSFDENFSDPFEYSGSVYLVSAKVLYKVIE